MAVPASCSNQPIKAPFTLEDNKQLPGILLYGQTIQPAKMILTGKLSTMGYLFTAARPAVHIRIDANEITGNRALIWGLFNIKRKSIYRKS